jgi:hypothetical protein
MRSTVLAVLFASLGIAAVVYTAGGPGDGGLIVTTTARAAENEDQKSGGPPPLVIDRGAPLLLEDPPEVDPLAVPLGPVADNTACFVCHTNYEEEEFADAHAKANVGCMECHGKSLAHRDDEDNITPPDTMYPPENIQANCEKCHDEHDVAPVDVITRWQERCASKTDPKEIGCMDCHGYHRLNHRTVRWDKLTGELLGRETKEGEAGAEGAGADQMQ